MDHACAAGNFQSGSCSSDLSWAGHFLPVLLNWEMTKQRHKQREWAEHIMKRSIIGHREDIYGAPLATHSFSGSASLFPPQVLIEGAIALKPCIICLHTESLEALRQMPIAQLLSQRHTPTSQCIICLNLPLSPFVSVSALPLFY